MTNLSNNTLQSNSVSALNAVSNRPSTLQDIKPGDWGAIPRQQPIDPATAKTKIENRVLPTNVYVAGDAKVLNSVATGKVKSFAPGFASNSVVGPASVVELARALRGDVDLIFEWVFNNIENHVTYGLQKGALGSIIDGFGNSFDQADLMVQLLRQAGYTANFVNGELRMNAAQAGDWLGTDPLNVFAAANFLANCLVPVTTIYNGTEWVMDFSHTWVVVNISGTDYYFDPALKTYTSNAGINLATAMGYNSATFLSDANSGATITSDYVQNMNSSNIRSNLDTLSSNLVDWIKTNNHGASMEDILGGRTINQYDANTQLRQTVHPFLKPGSTPTTWTSIPISYRTTMHVLYDTIDVTFYSDNLAGKRLTLFFNASHEAELRLDGTLIATSSAQVPGTWNSVLLEIVHPYPVTWADQSTWFQIWADKPYLLGHSFGHTNRKASQIHGRNEKANLSSGLAADSEGVLGELMAATWKMWDAANTQLANIINRMTDCTTANHHAAGVIGWFDTPFTNIGMVKWSTGALDNNYDHASTNDTVLAMHGVAMEAQIFNQFAQIDGVSTTPLIDIANSAGKKIYDATSSNWTTNVRPNLINYVSSDLDNIKSWWIDYGYRVGIPEDGQLTRGSWTGFGYYAIPTFGTFGIIQGGLKGGSGSQALLKNDWVSSANFLSGNEMNPGSVIGRTGLGLTGLFEKQGGLLLRGKVSSDDPVDMTSGDFLFGKTDITVGSMGFPYGLGFSRSYNSCSRFQDSPLGLGWTHNFQIVAQKATDSLLGLGSHSVVSAASSIAELFVAVDIQSDLTKPFYKYICSALASQWLIDSLTNNAVLVSTGQKEITFVKLRDGTYAPPKGCSDEIVIAAGGAYIYKAQTGAILNFNLDGTINTWVEPFGVTVSFTYTSGKLTSVANGLGRSLTFSYTGDRLTNVSDGTGRSVTYLIDTNKNLVEVIDQNGKSWTYEYDLPGRMVRYFFPANPTVAIATNTYDSLDRIKEQRDFQSNLWQYFFAGSRAQELNPNNKGSVIYLDSMGNVIKTINQVGSIYTSQYDGRGRLITSTAPEGNSVVFAYDFRDLVIQTTAKAKPGSGLSDIVTTMTYDPIWNKLKTITDNLGRVTTRNYDPVTGNLLNVVSPTVAGIGASTVVMTYNARGQLLTTTAPDGIVQKHSYDTTNETLLSTVVDYGIGRLNLTTNFGYNARGDAVTIQDPMGNTTIVDYDILRRVVQSTAPSPFNYVAKFTFDDNGNTIKIEKQTNEPDNPWQAIEATFRANNQIATVVEPQGATKFMQYDSLQRLWKVSDSNGRTTERVYDDANRIVGSKDPAGITSVAYTYTGNGRLATQKDSRNFITSYVYDGHDRVDMTSYPDSSVEQVLSRDGNGNPLTVNTRSGAAISFTYDELNRVKTKTPAGQPTITTVYDIAGRIITISTPVVPGDPTTGTLTNYFDSAGRFYKEQYPDGFSVTHMLDANGNITKTTYPDGYFIERVFDQLNRLTDVKLNGASTSALQFQYDALSRRTKLVYENGCSTNYSFSANGNLEELLHCFVGSSVDFKYSYDNIGQLVSQRTTDPANYRWAPAASGVIAYGVANDINQYPTVGGVAFTYSTDGNLIDDGVYKYEYNAERMLTRVRDAGSNAIIADYLYDPVFRQRQKNVGGLKTNFYYSGWQRLADYDGVTNNLKQRYVYGVGLDEVLIQISSTGVKTYFHGNHQGSIIAISDSLGAVVNSFNYSPYGESSSGIGDGSFGFTGQRYDAETGLYYYKMRYYSPRLGRFLQADPVGYAGGSNLYAYTSNSPLRSTDPLGLLADDFVGPYSLWINLNPLTGPFGAGRSGGKVATDEDVVAADRVENDSIISVTRFLRAVLAISILTTLKLEPAGGGHYIGGRMDTMYIGGTFSSHPLSQLFDSFVKSIAQIIGMPGPGASNAEKKVYGEIMATAFVLSMGMLGFTTLTIFRLGVEHLGVFHFASPDLEFWDTGFGGNILHSFGDAKVHEDTRPGADLHFANSHEEIMSLLTDNQKILYPLIAQGIGSASWFFSGSKLALNHLPTPMPITVFQIVYKW